MIHRYDRDIDTNLIYPDDIVHISFLSKNLLDKLYDKSKNINCKLIVLDKGKFHFKCDKYELRKKILKELNEL